MANIIKLLPELNPEEILFLKPLVEDMTDSQAKLFAEAYRLRRKDNVWLFLIVSFLGIGGVHRFVLGQIGLGLIYLFTYNLCFIGFILDLINQNSLVNKYNQTQAINTARVIKATIDD
tara:strand:- start:104 stop:457 length:354 start_codon:yes stop_codon:yes gene_type:complete